MQDVFYDEPLVEWLGRWDTEANCVMYPTSNPRVCLSYESYYELPQLPKELVPKLGTKGTAAVKTTAVKMCAELIEKLDRGACDAGVLQASTSHTCTFVDHAKGMSIACDQWIASTPNLTPLQEKNMERECHLQIKGVAKTQAVLRRALAENPAEAVMCFACSAELARACNRPVLSGGR